jgi:hypothetical protein
MKPIISLYVVLVLFQSLIFGNMASIELPVNNTYAFQETIIQSNTYLDPFLISENRGLNQNLLIKQDFVPQLFTNKYITGNAAQSTFAVNNVYSPASQQIPSTPIILLLGVLRI